MHNAHTCTWNQQAPVGMQEWYQVNDDHHPCGSLNSDPFCPLHITPASAEAPSQSTLLSATQPRRLWISLLWGHQANSGEWTSLGMYIAAGIQRCNLVTDLLAQENPANSSASVCVLSPSVVPDSNLMDYSLAGSSVHGISHCTHIAGKIWTSF